MVLHYAFIFTPHGEQRELHTHTILRMSISPNGIGIGVLSLIFFFLHRPTTPPPRTEGANAIHAVCH